MCHLSAENSHTKTATFETFGAPDSPCTVSDGGREDICSCRRKWEPIPASPPRIRDYVALEVRPLAKRLKELEARDVVPYKGTWATDDTYGRGDFTTHDGSLWIARRDCTGRRPGDDPSAWTLVCKRGRDGRNAP